MSDDNKDDAKPEGEGAEQLTIRVKDQVSFWRIMVPLMFDVCGCLWPAVDLDRERRGTSLFVRCRERTEGRCLCPS